MAFRKGVSPEISMVAGKDYVIELQSQKSSEDIRTMHCLIDANADLEIGTYTCGTTPLMMAASTGCFSIVQLLLRAGAKVNHSTAAQGQASSATPVSSDVNRSILLRIQQLEARKQQLQHRRHTLEARPKLRAEERRVQLVERRRALPQQRGVFELARRRAECGGGAGGRLGWGAVRGPRHGWGRAGAGLSAARRVKAGGSGRCAPPVPRQQLTTAQRQTCSKSATAYNSLHRWPYSCNCSMAHGHRPAGPVR